MSKRFSFLTLNHLIGLSREWIRKSNQEPLFLTGDNRGTLSLLLTAPHPQYKYVISYAMGAARGHLYNGKCFGMLRIPAGRCTTLRDHSSLELGARCPGNHAQHRCVTVAAC